MTSAHPHEIEPVTRAHRRIVVGIDGSPESRAALDWAVHEAHRTGGEIDAVLAYDSGRGRIVRRRF